MEAIAETVNTLITIWNDGFCWEMRCDNGVWTCLTNGKECQPEMASGCRIQQHIKCIEQFPCIPTVMADKMFAIDVVPEKLLDILSSGLIEQNYQSLNDLLEARQMTTGRLLVVQGNKRIGEIYGSHWDAARNERILRDTRGLKIWDIVRFYTNQYGIFDALQFVSFRDMADNCARSIRNRVYSFHNQKQLQTLTAIVSKQTCQIDQLRNMIVHLTEQVEELKNAAK